jgi:hypothetical protein
VLILRWAVALLQEIQLACSTLILMWHSNREALWMTVHPRRLRLRSIKQGKLEVRALLLVAMEALLGTT